MNHDNNAKHKCGSASLNISYYVKLKAFTHSANLQFSDSQTLLMRKNQKPFRAAKVQLVKIFPPYQVSEVCFIRKTNKTAKLLCLTKKSSLYFQEKMKGFLFLSLDRKIFLNVKYCYFIIRT